jgi:uncharacterized protein YlaN (UPF0358 family)
LIEPDTLIMVSCELIDETVDGRIYGLCADLHYQADRNVTISKTPDFNVPQ